MFIDMSEPTFTVQRTQYPFDTTNLKYKTRGEVLDIQKKWNIFEQVENYNDIIYQRFQIGLRNKTYYQFTSGAELKDYRAGQELHILKYPGVSFDSIANRPLPDVPIVEGPPNNIPVTSPILPKIPATDSSEHTLARSELAMYTYVSTYNATHHYQYNFTTNEEQIAYNRIRQKIESANGSIL